MERISQLRPFRLYWKLYGGRKSILTSIYFYAALLLTGACYPYWSNTNPPYPWHQAAIDIIPSVLGFSMGGMAIMLAFSGSKFFAKITEDGAAGSLFVKVIASFFHFILIQTLALVAALLSKGISFFLLSLLGFFLLSYAIAVSVATASMLLGVATVLNAAASIVDSED